MVLNPAPIIKSTKNFPMAIITTKTADTAGLPLKNGIKPILKALKSIRIAGFAIDPLT